MISPGGEERPLMAVGKRMSTMIGTKAGMKRTRAITTIMISLNPGIAGKRMTMIMIVTRRDGTVNRTRMKMMITPGDGMRKKRKMMTMTIVTESGTVMTTVNTGEAVP